MPLMAVQLPPEAAVDTTGSYSESYIVQGFGGFAPRRAGGHRRPGW
ncbi:hypothetical protein ACFQFQ_19045 [Sulfitobacter porphyrae]|uniref:Uncharacterized protein n=1 Tax=Sulfitobacter porphyrae TaxID=1246864 RepID=A0ABW2B5T1_9RHOB